MNIAEMTPDVIVELLGKHVEGQLEGKRALALAIRNRWRREQLPPNLRKNVKKQNILLKGPTGSGKTALVKAIEKELGWPIHFVDITQYSETGYKGKDLEDILKNFVRKYEDKPLPEWYVNGKAERDAKLNQKEKLSTQAATSAKNMPSAKVANFAYGGLALLLIREGYLPVDSKFDSNPSICVDGSTMTLVQYIHTVFTDKPEVLLCGFINYVHLCKIHGYGWDGINSLTVDERTSFSNQITFDTWGEDKTDPELKKTVSQLAGLDCGSYEVALATLIPVISTVSISLIESAILGDKTAEMLENRYFNNMWSLWTTAVYTYLVINGCWKPIKRKIAAGDKPLNSKARSALHNWLGYNKDVLKGASCLNDLWTTVAFDGVSELSSGITHYEQTVNLIIETQGRYVATDSRIPPMKLDIYQFRTVIGGGDDVLPWDKSTWLETLTSKRIQLRTALKLAQSEIVPSKPLLIWELIESTIRTQMSTLRELSCVQRLLFTGRPSKHWNEQEHTYGTTGYTQPPTKDDTIEFIQDYGICFLDEIDKIGVSDDQSMITRDGVQRGLLAMVEGAEFQIKEGAGPYSSEITFDTGRLMFVAAGAFSVLPIENLIPELRGRFPIVAEIHPLSISDYVHILKMAHSAVTSAVMLLNVEGLSVEVTECGYVEMAGVCEVLNRSVNLGARRLESVVDDVFIEPMMNPTKYGKNITIDRDYVRNIKKFTTIMDTATTTPDMKLVV